MGNIAKRIMLHENKKNKEAMYHVLKAILNSKDEERFVVIKGLQEKTPHISVSSYHNAVKLLCIVGLVRKKTNRAGGTVFMIDEPEEIASLYQALKEMFEE